MTIVDRYLFFLFLKAFLVCFLSFAGLFVIGHLFSNLDEMQDIGEATGWASLFREFYLPRVAEMFDKAAGMVTLAAAIFAVSLMQRRREMTAIEAAGITKARILRPIFLTSVVIIGLTIANRELLIPQVKDRLVRTPHNWTDHSQFDVTTQEDDRLGVVLRGDQLFLAERRISESELQLPAPLNQVLPRIKSTWAILEPANDQHPAGLWFHQVSVPADLNTLSSLQGAEGETVFFSPQDHDWLIRDQCFVAYDFDAEQIAYGDQLKNYQSTPEMIAELRKPQKWFGQKQQIGIHTRILRPILDMTLLLLGIPMVMGGIGRGVFVSAGTCFGIVALVTLTTMACSALGTASLIRPAALAAWIPVAVFLPLAIVAMRRLKR